MVVRLQHYDSSSLKAKYEPTNKKAFYWKPKWSSSACEYCYAENTPLYLTISFSGVVDCPNCTKYNGHNFWFTYSESFAAHYNNQSFLLTQHPTNECLWHYMEEGSYGIISLYDNDACAGAPVDTYDIDRFHISAAATDSFGTPKTSILVDFYDMSDAVDKFYGFYKLSTNRAPYTGCMNVVKSDAETCGDRRIVADSGTATIVEGDLT